MSRGAGAPVQYTPEILAEWVKKIEKYTEETEIPILAEFAYKNDIRRTTLYDHVELSNAIKKLIAKKEAQLERKALSGEVNTTMAVFSLKQIGWTDKLQTENKTTIEDKRDLKNLSDKDLKKAEELAKKLELSNTE